MTSSTILSEEQMTLVEPRSNHMFERYGFDRKNLRYEMANVNEVDPSVRKIEEKGRAYVHPDSDVTVGPTTVGESAGTIDLVSTGGETHEMLRFVNGFEIFDEDTEVDEEHVRSLRDSVLELFDFRGDAAFLNGVEDENGNTVIPSALSWVQDAVSGSSREIDCSTYDLSAGDLNGVAANVVTVEAMGEVSGELVTDSFGTVVGKHPALSRLNSYLSDNNNQTHWQMMADAVGDKQVIPPQIALPAPQGSDERIEVAVDDLGDDDLILLPEQAKSAFWRLYENPTPAHRSVEKEGFKEKHEYRWRYLHTFDPQDRYADATDAVVLRNVSDLF